MVVNVKQGRLKVPVTISDACVIVLFPYSLCGMQNIPFLGFTKEIFQNDQEILASFQLQYFFYDTPPYI